MFCVILLFSCCCCRCWVASVVSDSVRPHRRQPTRLPCSWDSPARILEWVAISVSNAWKWKAKVKLLSRVWLLATPWTAAYQAPPCFVAKLCLTLCDPMYCSTRGFCPSLSPGVCSNSCLTSWPCCLTISSSVTCFSFCFQSSPASGSFPLSWLFASGG